MWHRSADLCGVDSLRHKDKEAPLAHVVIMQNLACITEEPSRIDGGDGTGDTQNLRQRTTMLSTTERSRPRLDTEEGGRGSARKNDSDSRRPSRQGSSGRYNKDYYYDCDRANYEDGPRIWEDELYEQWAFKLVLLAVLLAMFGVWTWLAQLI